MKKRKSFLTLLSVLAFAATSLVVPNVSFGANFTDAQLQLASVDGIGETNTEVVGAFGETFTQEAVPTTAGPQAPKTIERAAGTSATVNNQAELQTELDNGTEHITISTSFTLTSPLNINNTADYQVLIDGPGTPITLSAATGQRHININATGILHLTFNNVFLEGNGVGGGMHVNGNVTINNPEINNCFMNVNIEGGGIYANGTVRVEGGHITNNRGIRGGGLMVSGNHSLTVVGTQIKNNQANYTAAGDSGVGGGIGVGNGGSLVVDSCLIDGNITTANGNNDKGLGAGIGASQNTYTEVINSTVSNNVSANFASGIFAHWNSNLIVDGGTVSNNDTSGSVTYGDGGGVYAAAGTHLKIQNGTSILNNKGKYGGGGRAEYATVLDIGDGVVFRGNQAINSGGGFSLGASTYVGRSTINIGSAIFENNTSNYGAAIYIGRGFDIITNNTQIINNTSGTSGGAFYIQQENTITFNNNRIDGNTAKYGGAIYNSSAANAGVSTLLTINDSSVSRNSAAVPTTDGQGGGIIGGYFSHININRSTLDGNTGDYSGGLIAFADSIINFDSSSVTNNTANLNGGGIYIMTRSIGNIHNTQINLNQSLESGGGIYIASENMVLNLTGNSTVDNNNAGEYGGGIASASAKSITLQDTASVTNNKAALFGGGIYAHTGSAAGTDTIITIKDNTVVSGNSATNGGGISGGSLDMPDNIPTISLEGNTQIKGNIASADGGGIWVPHPHLDKITAAATTAFSNNQSVQAYFMLDSSPDVAIHQSHIFTNAFTTAPGGVDFTYAYNNDDIVYIQGIPLVVVTFDSTGGTPASLQSSGKQGEGLGTAAMPQNPVRDGFKFLGWYTEPNGQGTVFDQDTIVDADITVYAFWEEIPVPPVPPVPPKPEDNTGNLSGLPKTGGYEIYVIGLSLLGLGFIVGRRVLKKSK